MITCDADEIYMREALRLAEQAFEEDEVPVGAVITRNGKIIGKGYNQRETLKDPTAHAEIIAITAAASAKGDWRLNDCELFVTLEPCTMCAGAIVLARFKRVIFAAHDPKAGAVESLYTILTDSRLNHRAEITSGVLAQQAGALLSEFFQKKRAMQKNLTAPEQQQGRNLIDGFSHDSVNMHR